MINNINQILLAKITDSMWKSIHCCQNFTDLKDRHFLPSWQLRATFFLLIQVILEKNQVQVFFLINKQGEAVKNWNAKIWWNDWLFFMLYRVKITCVGKQSRSWNLALKCKRFRLCHVILILLSGFSLSVPWKEFRESYLTLKLFAFQN